MDLLTKCTRDYSYWASKYLEKFGDESLEGVLLPDLAHDDEKDFKEMAEEFKKSLKTGVPLEPISTELRDKIIR